VQQQRQTEQDLIRCSLRNEISIAATLEMVGRMRGSDCQGSQYRPPSAIAALVITRDDRVHAPRLIEITTRIAAVSFQYKRQSRRPRSAPPASMTIPETHDHHSWRCADDPPGVASKRTPATMTRLRISVDGSRCICGRSCRSPVTVRPERQIPPFSQELPAMCHKACGSDFVAFHFGRPTRANT